MSVCGHGEVLRHAFPVGFAECIDLSLSQRMLNLTRPPQSKEGL